MPAALQQNRTTMNDSRRCLTFSVLSYSLQEAVSRLIAISRPFWSTKATRSRVVKKEAIVGSSQQEQVMFNVCEDENQKMFCLLKS